MLENCTILDEKKVLVMKLFPKEESQLSLVHLRPFIQRQLKLGIN